VHPAGKSNINRIIFGSIYVMYLIIKNVTKFETKYGKLFNFYVDYTDGIKTVYRLYEQYMLDDEKDEKSFNFVVIVQQV